MKRRFWSEQGDDVWLNEEEDGELAIIEVDGKYTVNYSGNMGTSRIHSNPYIKRITEARKKARDWMKKYPLGSEEKYLEIGSASERGEVKRKVKQALKEEDMWVQGDQIDVISEGHDDGEFSIELAWRSEQFGIPIMAHGREKITRNPNLAQINPYDMAKDWDYTEHNL